MKRLFAALLLIGAALAAPANAQAVAASGTTCPGTFQVMHNDHIGRMALPAGRYVISVQPGITCPQAARRFTSFLQDFDGKLPRPWGIDPATRAFGNATTGTGFIVTRVTGPVPSGPTRNTGEGRQCNGTFRIMHDDQIGSLKLPAGPYKITLAANEPVTCAKSARMLQAFLDEPNGDLQTPWGLIAKSGTFTRRGVKAFRIKPAA